MTIADAVRTDDVVVLTPPAPAEVPAPRVRDGRVSSLVGGDWGWLPAISLSSALALLLVALAYNGARTVAHWTDLPFWFGLVLLFAPVAARLLMADVSRRERMGLLSLFGLGLYLVKVFQYPLFFTYHGRVSSTGGRPMTSCATGRSSTRTR